MILWIFLQITKSTHSPTPNFRFLKFWRASNRRVQRSGFYLQIVSLALGLEVLPSIMEDCKKIKSRDILQSFTMDDKTEG